MHILFPIVLISIQNVHSDPVVMTQVLSTPITQFSNTTTNVMHTDTEVKQQNHHQENRAYHQINGTMIRTRDLVQHHVHVTKIEVVNTAPIQGAVTQKVEVDRGLDPDLERGSTADPKVILDPSHAQDHVPSHVANLKIVKVDPESIRIAPTAVMALERRRGNMMAMTQMCQTHLQIGLTLVWMTEHMPSINGCWFANIIDTSMKTN